MSSIEDDDDIPQLSADTLAALQGFYAERDTKQKQFEDLKAKAEKEFEGKLSMEAFTEDWNASQFWYNGETATILAQQLLEGATSETTIAVVSAPTAFVQIKNILAEQDPASRPQVTLLEFDERFAVFKEFVKYDFEHPTRLPVELKGSFDRIICDPPFLSQDCQTKAALTVRWLARSWTSPGSHEANSLRFISCTGERMKNLILKLYSKIGIRTTDFEPKHAKGLSNEFRCYANFECSAWKWIAEE
ncbi:N-6 adenine-specific DNA methyltransferas-like protein 2 [Delitschia confertaspora ATCC 74209]|uniref:Protein-lysine N-methyltransferase EFM5 n=1 Tax=Delitschia confertaspora ATCC 74209 TaxID=1513339 RepID=A0A9P4JJG4_9PLEO|nr:N-6 adenine-specific DNA methyltransferas-like protein 2 [Delitschia confertaspora ATCC 74209]